MKKIILAVAAATATVAGAMDVRAAGMLDAADPCIGVRNDFAAYRSDADIKLLAEFKQNMATAPSADYRTAWIEEMRTNHDVRKAFDQSDAALAAKAGGADMEKAYAAWFDHQLELQGAAKIDALVAENWKAEVTMDYRQAEANLDAQKHDLDKSCKMDVGSQAERVVLNQVLAPVGMLSRNLELTKREPSVVGKFLAPSGFSLEAAKKNPLGGKNSTPRKILHDAFGW